MAERAFSAIHQSTLLPAAFLQPTWALMVGRLTEQMAPAKARESRRGVILQRHRSRSLESLVLYISPALLVSSITREGRTRAERELDRSMMACKV